MVVFLRDCWDQGDWCFEYQEISVEVGLRGRYSVLLTLSGIRSQGKVGRDIGLFILYFVSLKLEKFGIREMGFRIFRKDFKNLEVDVGFNLVFLKFFFCYLIFLNFVCLFIKQG